MYQSLKVAKSLLSEYMYTVFYDHTRDDIEFYVHNFMLPTYLYYARSDLVKWVEILFESNVLLETRNQTLQV